MCCDQGQVGYRLYFNDIMVKQGGNFGSFESTEFGDEGKTFDAFYQGQDYVRTCEWILVQNTFSIAQVCNYPNGNAGEVCTCVCA